MDYLSYKFLHLAGVLFLFTALGGMAIGARHQDAQVRKLGSIVHGLSLLVLLVSGFGLIARLGIGHDGIPMWIWIKLALWLVFGASVVLIKRWQGGRVTLWLLLPVIGLVAAYLGLFHPPVGG